MPRYFKMRARDTACVPLTYVTWVVEGAPDSAGLQAGVLPCGVDETDLADIQVIHSWIGDPQPSNFELYVDLNAAATGATGAKERPFTLIQDALDATDNTGVWTIHIAAGDYSTAEPLLTIPDDRSLSIKGPTTSVRFSVNALVTLGDIEWESLSVTTKSLNLEYLIMGTITLTGTEFLTLRTAFSETFAILGDFAFECTVQGHARFTGSGYLLTFDSDGLAFLTVVDGVVDDVVDAAAVDAMGVSLVYINGTVDGFSSQSGAYVTIQGSIINGGSADYASIDLETGADCAGIAANFGDLSIRGTVTNTLEAINSRVHITDDAVLEDVDLRICSFSYIDTYLGLSGTLFRMIQCTQVLGFTDLEVEFLGDPGIAFVDRSSIARHFDGSPTVYNDLTITNGTEVELDPDIL